MKAKKINTIYETTDYAMFKALNGNRRLNIHHANRLMKSIEQESLCVPIIINENYEVIDGQHRLYCWEKLGLPAYYVLIPGYRLPQVQRLNNNSKTWKISDYADSYCELGYKDYCKYKEFRKMYDIGDYECIAMLEGNMRGSGKSFANFRDGKFKIKSWNRACKEAEEITKYKPLYDGWKKRSFVIAMLHLINHKDFKPNQLLNKFKKFPSKVQDCVNSEQYIAMLDKLYNYNQSDKVSLLYN